MTPWAPGTQVLHRFLMHGVARDVRPVTVLADAPEALVLWLADGTATMTACLPGGVDLRSVSKAEMFGEKWQSKPRPWRNHVLKVLPHGAPYAVWSFFTADGEFLFWYANLQSPYQRWEHDAGVRVGPSGCVGGVDIVDHQLDLVVTPTYDLQWKDMDELAAAVAAGWFTGDDSDGIYAEAHRLAALASKGVSPFDHGAHALCPAGPLPLPRLPSWWADPAPDGPASAVR